MVAVAPARSAAVTDRIWGLDAVEVHDAYWASVGVSCVRLGSGVGPDPGADVFLLLEPDQLAVFDLRALAETLLWNAADLTRVQLIDPGQSGYRERLVFGADGSVLKVERRYKAERRVSGQVLAGACDVADTLLGGRTRVLELQELGEPQNRVERGA